MKMTPAVIVRANGAAFANAVYKKDLLAFFVFDANIVKNDGYASIKASINVI